MTATAVRAGAVTICDNETSPRGAGNTTEGSNPEIAYTIGGLAVSLPNFTSKSSRGAASEMYACAYLLSQGYHVFRAVSHTCPFDLVAYRGDELLRVEVKSLGLAEVSFAWPVNDTWDLLIVVDGRGACYEFLFGTSRKEAYDAIRAAYGLLPGQRSRIPKVPAVEAS